MVGDAREGRQAGRSAPQRWNGASRTGGRAVACALALAIASALASGAAADETKPPADGGGTPAKDVSKDATKGAAPAKDAAKPATDSAAPAPAKRDAAARAEAPALAARAPEPRSLDEALRMLQRRRCDVDFKDLPLDDVAAFVARLSRLNVIVSPELQRASAGALPAITIKLRDVTLRQFAEIVAKSTGSKLMLRDGILQFTTPADARGRPSLRVFSIADVTFRIRNFPGPDIQLHTGDEQFVQEEESDQATPFDDPQTIVDLIRKFTGEGTWDDDAVSISADAGKLVVKQYPEVLKEIARFLAVLRAAK